MKKLLYTLLAAAATMFAVGCAKEAQMVDPALTGETVEATFTVGFADALTKAVSDGLSATQLVVGVYDKDLGYVESLSILPTSSAYKTAFVDHTATFNARLVKGHGYDLVFLAVAPDNGAYTIDLAAKTFTVNPEGLSNDDKRDAFYAVRSIEKVTGAVNQAVVLTRPFAQLNVISSKDDYEAAAAARTVVGKSALKMAAPSVLNLVDGTVDTPVAYNLAAADMPEEKVNFEPYKTRGDYWLLTDYILVGESDMLDVNFLLYAEGSDDVLFEYNIPSVAFKRNYRTNVYGSILTADSEFVITIDPMYDGELPLDYTGGEMPDIQMYDTTLPAPGSRITVKPGDKINFRAIHPVEGVEAAYTSSSVSIGNFKVDQGDAEYIFKALAEGTTVVTISFPPVNGGEVDPGDNPGGDEPGGDEPGGDEPGGDEPGGDEPGGDEPGGDEPGGDEPGGDEPGGDEPGGDEPGDDDAGEPWAYTFTANPFSAEALTQTLDGKSWTLDMTGSTYFGFEGSNSARGAQFGKKAEPATKITLTSNFGSDYGVKKVVVNAAGASGTDAALSVKVGDVVLKCAGAATASVTTAATEYTFVADAVVAGDIVIAMEQTAAAAMYVKSISINPGANSNARPIYTKAEAAAAGVNYAACTLIYTVVVSADGEDPNPPAPGSNTYTKVTAAPEDWSGEYLIVYEGGEDGAGAVAFNGALTEKLDVASNGVAVTIANGEIAPSEAIDAATFTIAAMEGGYSIKSASGIFISFSGASDKNGMTESADAVANTIAIDGEDGLLKISSDANVHWLKYNKASNDVRFRFYKAASEQQPVALYKKSNSSLPPEDPEEPVTAVITASDISVEVGAEKAVGATTNSSAPITYTVDESGVYTVTADGVVTGVTAGQGKLLLKVEAVEGEFTAAEKEITVTVTAAGGGEDPEQPGTVDVFPEVDGNFSEWATVPAVSGTGAIQTMKGIATADKVFFYIEVDKTQLYTDAISYANYLRVYLGTGEESGEQTSAFDGYYKKEMVVWLYTGGVAKMSNWKSGFAQKAEVVGNVVKYEFCWNRDVDASLVGTDILTAGMRLQDRQVDDSSGSEVKSGTDEYIGFAPAKGSKFVVLPNSTATGPDITQQPKTISIDGNFDDWADVPGTETTDVYRTLKVSYDSDYIYIYSKRIPGSRGDQLWNETSPGYYYYDFDLDNDPNTGEYTENSKNYEAYMYLYIFGGSKDNPVLIEEPDGSYRPKGDGIPNLMENIVVKSKMHDVGGETIIESEFRIIRANFPTMGKTIRVHSWGSKDAQQIDRTFTFAD